MDETTMIVGLCGAITAMAGYIVHIHNKYSKIINDLSERYAQEVKELLTEQIKTALSLETAITNNTKAIDRSLSERK